jgi:hypothetical protein
MKICKALIVSPRSVDGPCYYGKTAMVRVRMHENVIFDNSSVEAPPLSGAVKMMLVIWCTLLVLGAPPALMLTGICFWHYIWPTLAVPG